MHLLSHDPSRVLLAPSITAAGLIAIDVTVPSETAFNFHVQGTDWIPGTSSAATVTIITTAKGAKTVTATAGINFPSAFGALGRALHSAASVRFGKRQLRLR